MMPATAVRAVAHPWNLFGAGGYIKRSLGGTTTGGAPQTSMANSSSMFPTPTTPTGAAITGMTPAAAQMAAQTSAPAASAPAAPASAPASAPTSAPASSTPGTSTQSNIANASNSLASDQTTFLKLLTTQLQNQDPLSPMDTNAFTQQLVAMTGVQQQILSNQLLQQMVSAQGGLGSAVGLIGKDVKVATGAATLQSGDAEWNYNIPANAANVTFTVIDSSGNTVYSSSQSGVGSGDHTFDWNGVDLTGAQRADGTTFGLKVNATAADGSAISSTTWLQGTVSSIQQINGETVALVDGTQVPLNLISSVSTS